MNILRIFILCLMWVTAVQPVNSQVSVTPSKKKVVIEGKSYYLHTVKQGETLYSICKAYNVMQKDVVFSNPDALEGIRVGQELKIPIKVDGTAVNQLESAQFFYHITEKGQTTYWLTQHYNISLETLYKYNPDLEHSPLQAGQVVTIPKGGNTAVQQAKPQASYTTHVVKKKETLFSIAKSYNVDLNLILEENPEIDANDLKIKIGQEVKIPLPDSGAIGIPIEMSKADTVIIRQDLEKAPQNPAMDTNNELTASYTAPVVIENISDCATTSQTEFRIAMLLPWFLADNSPASPPDSAMVKDNEGRFRYKNGQYWINPRSANAIEFYQGALLALDSLKKQGLNAKIYVFDTMRDTAKMGQILKSPVMKDMDMIIGPFYTELVNQVARFAQENRIYYVSPIAINTGSLRNNPYLMQVNAGEINAVGLVADFISKRENVQVTLIGNKSEADQTLFQAYLNKLKTVVADSMITVCQFRPDSIPHQPGKYLKRKKMNVVIIPVSDEAFVNILTAQLNAAAHSFQINLYGLAEWTKFVNLDQEYLHSLEFRYATAFYIDYEKPQVQQFLRQFRKVYHTEPTMLTGRGGVSSHAYQFAFLGYDVAYYFASSLQKYGKGFGYCIPNFRMPMLQSDFHFTKIDPLSGYMNTNLGIYKYTKDYNIVKEDITK